MAWRVALKRRMTTIGVALLLAITTIAIAVGGTESSSGLRHLYLAPTLWAALAMGGRAGGLTGLTAGLLQAPFTLPAMERLGLASSSVDGLVAMVLPAAVGVVVGRLCDQARDRGQRLQTVLEIQRSLSRDLPLKLRLESTVEGLRVALGAERVALLIGDGSDGQTLVSAPAGLAFDARSTAGWTARTGESVFIGDVHHDHRLRSPLTVQIPYPVRGLVVPLDRGSVPIGALAVERAGSFLPPARIATREMALHLGLAVENARLAQRQRRFTEELETKVREATHQLRELDRHKSEFVSVVAHELRTPLTALQGFSELLLARAVAPERAARFLCHLHNEAQRLGRIVSQLLDLSRIESGGALNLKQEPVDVNEIIERNIELFAAQHSTHRFEMLPYSGQSGLRADRDAVDRMLKNLISNAVKYSPAGGRVYVTASAAGDRANVLEMAVEDDGVGIPARELGRIFDKYVRIPHRETAGVRGLGLGLTLVRALAEAHGGSVEVESLPGKGSKFRILLPI